GGVADGAVGGQPGLVAVLDEAGVSLAEGAGDAGALVALFLPASRPAWWAEAASSWARSRRSYSTWPKASPSGRSASRSAMRPRMPSASARRAWRMADRRISRSSEVCLGAEWSPLNMRTFLALRLRGRCWTG